MKLTRREEIAIAILVACARAGSQRIRSQEAARLAGASGAHTAQVVHRLMRVGLVDTQRDRHGGIRLIVDAEKATLGDVLRRFGHREDALVRPPHSNDPLAAIASAAVAQAAEAFDSFTIGDLASDRVGEKLACFECSIRLGALRGQHRNPPSHAYEQRASA